MLNQGGMPTRMRSTSLRSACLFACAATAVAGCNSLLGIDSAQPWTDAGAGQAGATATGGVSPAAGQGGGLVLGGRAGQSGSAGTTGGNNPGGAGGSAGTSGGKGGNTTAGTGGAPTTGGVATVGGGGAATTGGVTAVGGSCCATGGVTTVGGNGGAPLTGGVATVGGNGGAATTGGVATTGGSAPTGGQGGSCTANLQNDPSNCGACGKSCILGDCSSGACQVFQVYANNGIYGWDMALLDATTSSPQRLLVTGYTFFDIALMGNDPTYRHDYPGTSTYGFMGLAAVGSDYFLGSYGSSGDGSIYTGSADALQVQQDPTEWYVSGYAGVLAADATHVYWADCSTSDDVTIRRRSRVDSTVDTVAASLGFCPSRMLMDGTTLWFTAILGQGVYWIDTSQALPATPRLVNSGSGTRALAVDSAFVYWTTWQIQESYYYSAIGTLCRAPKSNLASITYYSGTWKGPISLARDGQWLYVASEGTANAAAGPFYDGAIYRVQADFTGARETVAANQIRPRVVLVTANAVYWMTKGDNPTPPAAVYGLAK
jgi:hypothetical protein